MRWEAHRSPYYVLSAVVAWSNRIASIDPLSCEFLGSERHSHAEAGTTPHQQGPAEMSSQHSQVLVRYGPSWLRDFARITWVNVRPEATHKHAGPLTFPAFATKPGNAPGRTTCNPRTNGLRTDLWELPGPGPLPHTRQWSPLCAAP